MICKKATNKAQVQAVFQIRNGRYLPMHQLNKNHRSSQEISRGVLHKSDKFIDKI